MRIVDLSFPIRPHFRWQVSRQLRSSHQAGANFQSSILTVSCHAYTHVDAPVHFLPGDRDITAMPVDQWMGSAAVVDLTHLGDNGEVTADDLARQAGHVKAGDIVLLRTDWPRRTKVESERFWSHAPWTSRGACDWLVGRRVKAVGYDYPPDYCIRTTIFSPGTPVARYDCTTHDVFFPAGITVIEYLTNLDAIGVPRCRFIALPLAIRGLTAPAGPRGPPRGTVASADRRRRVLEISWPHRVPQRIATQRVPWGGSPDPARRFAGHISGSGRYGVEIAEADSASA